MYRAVMTSKPIIPSFCLLPLAALATACGGADPTPEAEEAATGPEVNAAVNRAQTQAVRAQEVAEARQEAEEAAGTSANAQ